MITNAKTHFKKEIRLIKDVRQAVDNQFGPGVSKAFENMGFFDSGDRTTTFNTIRQYLNDLKKGVLSKR